MQQVVCGECLITLTNYPPGNGNIIILSQEGAFERKNNDASLFKGSYSIQKNKECNKSSGDMALMTNEGQSPSPQFIEISGDKLTLSTPYCYSDGGSAIYRRVK